ncbi:gene transfer agent family protein [uncultured Parasphingorhabdus sp.]|uniref:gene transfer agent family protein n=1 Tax=uncultured Parasphingorhabdus sp. TaxID=2709694 RepID=UPI002AA68DDB|nr:gene transfer agent family protein [uncultured Parasphingorhabdus sp.]
MTDRPANALRGEAEITINGTRLILRPSFAALVTAEEELGSLLDLVERAASGRLLLSEIVALFWHVARDRPEHLTRDQLGEGMMKLGLAGVTPALKILLKQILSGRG